MPEREDNDSDTVVAPGSAVIKTYDAESEYYFVEGCYITELSNSTSDAQASIARARVEPGKVTHWHYLLGVTERYVILQGSGMVSVGDNAARRVNVGDVVIIPPGVRQRIANHDTQDLVFLAICTPRFEPSVYVSIDT